MTLIYETNNFELVTHEQPFVSRKEGGHIKIVNKNRVPDRTKLSPKEAIELMWFTMIAGEAFEKAMINRGISIVKVNYQDMGNWAYKSNAPFLLHVHIFGRVLGAKHQPFPESVYLPARETGYYEGFEPLNEDDIKEIKSQIELLLQEKKYDKKEWGLC